MHEAAKRTLIWAPRILTMAFAAFLMVFALDVFDEPATVAERAAHLALHLIPSALVLLGLAVSWKREWVAALLFPLLALWHLFSGGHLHWTAYLAIDGPLLVMAALFLISWRIRTAPSGSGGHPSLG